MKTPKTITIAFGAAVAVGGAANAYCSEPSSEPWCLSDDSSFQDSGDFDSCRWDVESFVDEVNDYVSCLDDEINDMRDDQEEAIEQANEVVRRFNCGADNGAAYW